MIRNLVFDLGNVLVYFHPEWHLRSITASDKEAMSLRDLIFESPAWKAGDRGVASRQEISNQLICHYPQQAEVIRWVMAECSHWLTMPETTMSLLQTLKAAGYHLYYISNTNREDFTAMSSSHVAWSLLEGGVASFREGILKPDSALFQLLLSRYRLQAEECLFVDDMPANTRAAAALGFQTILLTGGPDTLRAALAGIEEINKRVNEKWRGE